MQTIEEGKAYLRDHMSEGADCPLCTQYVRLWKHSVNSSIARTLIKMYRLRGRGWVHIMNEIGYTTMYGIAQHWDLIEPKEKNPDEDKRASGQWRLTVRGEMFVKNETSIPKHLYIYNNRVITESDDRVHITDSLGKKFSYRELMGYI